MTELAGSPIRVLLVEDDEDDYTIVRDLLAEATGRYELEWAATYEDGLSALGAGSADVCLLDFRLGEHTALDFLAEAKERRWRLPVIVVTGQGDRNVDLTVMDAGATDYLVKGAFDPPLLERCLRYTIERRRVTSELERAEEEVRQLNAGLERELEKRLGELQQARERVIHCERLAALGKIGAGVAHEINNPLMGIQSAIEYSLEILPPGTDVYKNLGMALGFVHRCTAIVSNLLTYSRTAAGAKKELGNLNAALQTALNLTRKGLTATGVDLELRLAKIDTSVSLDEGHLEQVLVNLVTNARDAMADGPHRKLLIESKDAGDHVILAVYDPGKGMDAATLGSAFEPFFTTKPPGSGTGLGLYICRNLVESNGGHIEVDSAPGAGTTFTLVLQKAASSHPTARTPLNTDDLHQEMQPGLRAEAEHATNAAGEGDAIQEACSRDRR